MSYLASKSRLTKFFKIFINTLHQACIDTVSYCLMNEVYDRFAECHSLEAANFGALPCAIFAFLTASIRTLLLRKKVPSWKTEFISMLERTELLGAVSILYGSIVLDSNSEGSSGGIKLTPELERQSILILQAMVTKIFLIEKYLFLKGDYKRLNGLKIDFKNGSPHIGSRMMSL